MTFDEWWEDFVAEHDDWKYATSEALRRAAFQAGAASRDAEVVSLTNQRDYEYVRAENAEQERDQLREQVKMLRDVVGHVAGMRFSIVTTKMCEAALAATEPNK